MTRLHQRRAARLRKALERDEDPDEPPMPLSEAQLWFRTLRRKPGATKRRGGCTPAYVAGGL